MSQWPPSGAGTITAACTILLPRRAPHPYPLPASGERESWWCRCKPSPRLWGEGAERSETGEGRFAPLFGRLLDRWRVMTGAGWQVEQIGRQAIEIGQDFRGRHDIGVFGVHVAEAHRVARLAAVEAALFGEDHAVIEAECVDRGGADAARGGGAD